MVMIPCHNHWVPRLSQQIGKPIRKTMMISEKKWKRHMRRWHGRA